MTLEALARYWLSSPFLATPDAIRWSRELLLALGLDETWMARWHPLGGHALRIDSDVLDQIADACDALLPDAPTAAALSRSVLTSLYPEPLHQHGSALSPLVRVARCDVESASLDTLLLLYAVIDVSPCHQFEEARIWGSTAARVVAARSGLELTGVPPPDLWPRFAEYMRRVDADDTWLQLRTDPTGFPTTRVAFWAGDSSILAQLDATLAELATAADAAEDAAELAPPLRAARQIIALFENDSAAPSMATRAR